MDAVSAFLMLVAMNNLPPVSLPLAPLVTCAAENASDLSNEHRRSDEEDVHTSIIKPIPVYSSRIVYEPTTSVNRQRLWIEQPETSASAMSTSPVRAFRPFTAAPDDYGVIDVDDDTEMEFEPANGTGSEHADIGAGSEMKDPPVRQGRPSKVRLQEVKLKECRRTLLDIAKHTNEHTNACPYCVDSPKFSPNQLIMHLLRHAGGSRYYPYQCPKPHCDFTSIDSFHAKSHFVKVHQGRWTGRIEALADHTENQARIREWRELFVNCRKQRREKHSSA